MKTLYDKLMEFLSRGSVLIAALIVFLSGLFMAGVLGHTKAGLIFITIGAAVAFAVAGYHRPLMTKARGKK